MHDDATDSPLPPGTDAPLANEPPVEVQERPVTEPADVVPPFESAFSAVAVSPSPAVPRRRGIPGSLWLLAVLIPYAVVATLAVIYLLQQQHQGQKQPHVLESIPDQGLYEDFLEGRRREAVPPLSQAGEKPPAVKVIPANEPMPPEVPPVKLGETRRVGDLAVTPLEVTRETLRYDYRNGQRQVLGEDALVLKLQVKNEGKLIFRPDDETFNRAHLDDSRAPVYTYLQAGPQRFYGAVAQPAQERVSFPPCGSLLPGETGTIHVIALNSGDGKTAAVSALSGPGPFLWRVQLRRGKEEVTMTSGRKRSVWVTAMVGIAFGPEEVKNPASSK